MMIPFLIGCFIGSFFTFLICILVAIIEEE